MIFENFLCYPCVIYITFSDSAKRNSNNIVYSLSISKMYIPNQRQYNAISVIIKTITISYNQVIIIEEDSGQCVMVILTWKTVSM